MPIPMPIPITTNTNTDTPIRYWYYYIPKLDQPTGNWLVQILDLSGENRQNRPIQLQDSTIKSKEDKVS